MVEAAQRRTGADLPRVNGAGVMRMRSITRSVQPVPRESLPPLGILVSYTGRGADRAGVGEQHSSSGERQ